MTIHPLPPVDHSATSEELRLRVVAQTNGENAAAGQRALSNLVRMDYMRRQKEDRQRHEGRPNTDAQTGG